jgi:hypothetical protein
LLDYLTRAAKVGQLSANLSEPALIQLFKEHYDRWWSGKVDYCNSKDACLRYISRYLRRPPLAEYRLLSSDGEEIRFLTKDKRVGNTVTALSKREFIDRLADQVQDKYRHGVRYFGLLAPRVIGKDSEVFLALLGQRKQIKPKPPRWADSIRSNFHRDPLLDSDGKRMYWVGQLAPVRPK